MCVALRPGSAFFSANTRFKRSADIVASDPSESDAFFEPARDKVYRHPTFYDIPDEVKTL